MAAAVALLVGCSEAAVDGADGTIAGESVCFNFIIDEQWQGATLSDGTRAVVDNAEDSATSQIANMIVLQYNSVGNCARYDYYATFDTSQDISIATGAETIIFIANTFDADGELFSASSTATLSNLKDITTAIEAHNDVLMDDGDGTQYIVMSGSINLTSTTQTSTVTLSRNCARLDITVDNQISSDWSVSNIETLNVPTTSYLYTNYTLSDLFPASGYFETTDIEWGSDERTAAVGSGARIYLPINKRGTNTSSTESMLRPLYAPENATAIRLTLASTDTTNTAERTYTFYLGNNTTTNFNILPNYAYTYTFTISSAGNSTTDPRIEVITEGTVFETEPEITLDYTNASVVAALTGLSQSDLEIQYNSSMNANCYILNPNGMGLIVYIPIEDKINNFWTNYEVSTSNQLASTETWYVDILWSDITGIEHTKTTSTTEATTSGDFSVQRVASAAGECYANTTSSQSALKVTLPNTFNRSTMHGNVVVGIRKGDAVSDYPATTATTGNYLWSWHFWITDYNPYGARSATIRSSASSEYVWDVTGGEVLRYTESSSYPIWSNAYAGKYIMDRPIGAISNTTYGTSSATKGFLYYQYGRKDPFSLYTTESTATTYPYRTGTSHSGDSTNDSMSALVQNPMSFSPYYHLPYESSTNYKSTSVVWNDPEQTASNDTYTDVGGKSIFDPSPLGWKVPSRYTWYAWDSWDSVTANYVFVSNQGGYFNFDGDSTASATNYDAFHPATGHINVGTGAFSDGGTNGYSWTCSPSSTSSFGYYMNFTGTNLSAASNSYRGYGFPVVPLQE